MAYIPPHLRHSKDSQGPSPVPEILEPIFSRKVKLDSSKHDAGMSLNTIEYGDHAVHRKFVCGLDNNNNNNNSISSDHSEEFPEEPDEHKRPVTVNLARDNDKACANTSRSPWESIAENVWPDVLNACNIVKNEMEGKPKMVARFGVIVLDEHISVVAAGNKRIHCLSTAAFLVRETNQSIAMARDDSLRLRNARERQVAETVFNPMRCCFETVVPAGYMEKIVHEVVPKIGLDFVEYKDIYYIKLYDGTRQISCKCTVKEDKKPELYKVETNQVRHMVADILCFDEDLDLRLALYTIRTLSALPDDEMNNIRILINSAIPDPKVMGGLRWPIGKSSSGNYTVVGVWHREFKSYKSPSLKLKVTNVDRFLFRTGSGMARIEIYLKFRRMISEIQEGEIDTDSLYNGFKDKLRLIWDHFLSWEDHD